MPRQFSKVTKVEPASNPNDERVYLEGHEDYAVVEKGFAKVGDLARIYRRRLEIKG